MNRLRGAGRRARRLLGARVVAALLIAFLGIVSAVPTATSADSRPPGSAEGTDLSLRYENPLLSPPLRPVMELRVAVAHILPKPDRARAWDHRRNGAVEYFDPLRLTDRQIEGLLGETTSLSFDGGQAWRTSTVEVDEMLDFLAPGVVAELRRHGVGRLIVVSALNNPRRKHSEQMIERVRKGLRIPDRARLYGASERQHCSARCAPLYPPDMPTGFGRVYGLSVEETARIPERVAHARRKAAGSGPEAQDKAEKEVRRRFEELERVRNASTRDKLHLDLDEVRRTSLSLERNVLRDPLFASPGSACPPSRARGRSGSAPGGAAASPPLVLAAADVRNAARAGCGESGGGGATPGAEEKGPAGADRLARATGVGAVLANPGMDNGGIDFTTLELRYLADPGDGSGLQYSFGAHLDPLRGDVRQSAGVAAARLSSDAFFVWLALDPQDFWVNLSPDEPDRVVEERLGRTDAGRVLLEADLRMKKTVGELIHPRTALGRRYWDGVRGDCVSSRTWIVPAPAAVHQDGDRLYILDAPLDVRTETDHATTSGGPAGSPACSGQDEATEAHNEHLERALVLPELRKAVNEAPEYADLRRVYLARVAAEWYRGLSARKHTTYGALMNSGDVTDWPVRAGWTPRDTFDEYVTSYTKGEFEVTDRTAGDGTTHVTKYSYGGVDLTAVPVREVTDGDFDAYHGALPAHVERSLGAPSVGGGEGTVWLGAPTPRQTAAGLGAADRSVSAGTWAVRLLPALLLPVGLLLWRRRRRLDAVAPSPLRRAARGGSGRHG